MQLQTILQSARCLFFLEDEHNLTLIRQVCHNHYQYLRLKLRSHWARNADRWLAEELWLRSSSRRKSVSEDIGIIYEK